MMNMNKTSLGSVAAIGIVLVAGLAGCGGGSGKSSAAKRAATCDTYQRVVTLDNNDGGGSAARYAQMRDLYKQLQKDAPAFAALGPERADRRRTAAREERFRLVEPERRGADCREPRRRRAWAGVRWHWRKQRLDAGGRRRPVRDEHRQRCARLRRVRQSPQVRRRGQPGNPGGVLERREPCNRLDALSGNAPGTTPVRRAAAARRPTASPRAFGTSGAESGRQPRTG